MGNFRIPRSSAYCPHCSTEFPIPKTVREKAHPPAHRLYAKLVLLATGEKVYLRATDNDKALYAAAERALAQRMNPYPVVPIAPGYNTNQALGYNYRHWHQMFNARQLLSISILGERIADIEEAALRDLFLCLLSGVLEFNNMFASYKGEGTGAVRHMFYQHILKPERVPLEANLWGTPKSSGSFSTLFESRILRALNYAADPFELRLGKKNGKRASEKVYGLSQTIGYDIAANYESFADGKSVYLSCADSSRTDIPEGSVDAVITDPPFFDNVHYSQLADFFYVWQRHFLGHNGQHALLSTRQPTEVQHSDCEDFTTRLCSVWKEAHRVLKADGLLAFTYHHSRPEGWSSILKAVMDADFVIVATHPVKSEMSVATPKQQAKEPIDLDIIMVCRKRVAGRFSETDSSSYTAEYQISRLRASGRTLSRNDVRIIVMSQLLRTLSQNEGSAIAIERLRRQEADIKATITRLASPQDR
jgi:putative DNA methylase